MDISREDIVSGIFNNEFIPFLQPIVCSHTGIVRGGEVLARWNHPVKGMVNAGLFIDHVIKYKLIYELTSSLMRDIVKNIINSFGYGQGLFLTLNANLSLLMEDKFSLALEDYHRHLSNANVKLIIEITEKENITCFKNAFHRLKKIRDLGVDFALDDFGTGFSNETLLALSKPNIIKLDKKFFRDKNCSKSIAFLRKAMRLAEIYKVKVIAEGIENNSQRYFAKDLGVEYCQGYLYSHPLTLEDFKRKYDGF